MLSSGQIMKHVEEVLIPTFQKRYYSMVRAIHELLLPLGVQILGNNSTSIPDNTVLTTQAGGYFLYIAFPEEGAFLDVTDIRKLASEKHLLQLAPGHVYQVNGPTTSANLRETFRRGLRLCWAWHEEEDIIEGIRRLAEVLKAAQSRSRQSGICG